ncbi:LPS export ABC transporter permease LptG [Paracoccus aerodenitrificans]|uniref:LPS export ABC transporter permease LptG n=1 Tax=Paracoccus aerodenitrificans TaxID=3017781 RepID=UPI0022F008B4|nr:LPS export ABC transporter permease LptG [Paracoccus aerodenitrificans]WBU64166.1 LPS export ABC transporter permease LptG [Paracoccus aerodenitrificans]
MTLARYIATRYLRSFLLLAGVFLAILLLIDMVEQIRRFSDDGISLGGAAKLSALAVAGSFYQILPLIGLLAGIALFLALSRSSEMVAIRASGRSALRCVAAPSIMAGIIGALAVAVLNPVVAATESQYSAAVTRIESGSTQTVSLGDDAVWLRQGIGDEGEQMMIRAARTSPDATTLYDASFIIYAPGTGPATRIEAQQARLIGNNWELSSVKEWSLTDPNPEADARRMETLSLPTELTADRIRDGFGSPDAIPIWELPGYIAGLKRAGFSALRHQVWLQMELALPLTLAAMVLIASVFTMRHMRGRRTGGLVLAAFAAGMALFFLRNMAQVLGDTAGVPPWLAGWAPPVVGILFAVGAILQLEDG